MRGRAIATAGVATALVWASPAAASDWLAPFTIADPPAGTPALALDGAGTAFVAWQDDNDQVLARIRPSGEAFGATTVLSGGAIEPPVVAADRRGDGVVAWIEQGDSDPLPRLAYRRVSAAGFGPTTVVPGPGESIGDLAGAVDGAGGIVLAWSADTDTGVRVRAASIAPDGATSVAYLSGANGDATPPAVAANGAGAAFVAWALSTAADRGGASIVRTRLQVARRASAAAALGGAEDVGPAAESVEQPTADDGVNTSGSELATVVAALDDLGGTLLGVQRLVNDPGDPDDGEDDSQRSQVEAALGAIDGGLGAPAQVSPAGQDTGEPVLAAGPGGEAVLAWTANGATALGAATRSAGGGFGDVETLAAAGSGRSLVDPVAAVRATGEAVVGWVDGNAVDGAGPFLTATHPPGGDFGARTISDGSARATSPALAADGEGNALAVWQEDPVPLAPDDTVQAAAFDGAGPRVTALVVPADGVTGDELRFGVAGADTWSAFTARWDFGDGTRGADGLNVSHAFARPGRYTVTATLTDATGNAVASAPRTVTVRAPGETAPPLPVSPASAASVPDAPRDTTRPVISGVRVDRGVFRVGDGAGPFVASAARAASLARGSALDFSLSEPARVQITVSRMAVVPGRRSTCVRLGAPPRGRATTIGRVGQLAVTLPAGARRIPFSGRIGSRPLARGRYAIRLQAVDGAGNVSRVREVRVTVC